MTDMGIETRTPLAIAAMAAGEQKRAATLRRAEYEARKLARDAETIERASDHTYSPEGQDADVEHLPAPEPLGDADQPPLPDEVGAIVADALTRLAEECAQKVLSVAADMMVRARELNARADALAKAMRYSAQAYAEDIAAFTARQAELARSMDDERARIEKDFRQG